MRPQTRYARSGEVSIAYQVLGDGPIDLVMVPGFVSHVEVAWEEPGLARFLSRLASFARLIVFDKRGTGLSDPVTTVPAMDQRMDDIRVVMDAAGVGSAAIFGVSEGGTLSLLFAHTHPERTRALILYGSWARRMSAPDYPWGLRPEELDTFLERMSDAWATGEWWTGPPVPNDDDRHRTWWARYLRMSASPSMAREVIRLNCSIDVRHLLADLNLPILILHRTGDTWIEVGHARYLAEHLPGARYVELPDTDHRLWLGDTEKLLREIEVFLTGARRRPRRRVAVGVAALSRRELEVARMAASGETAAEIASRLFVSQRTVQTQLASAYAKLGVRGKAELIQRHSELGL
jgi:pimeloyl-ACP methyl ester carboxylesterase/DNA-binding CsgD family transcriptional regulator